MQIGLSVVKKVLFRGVQQEFSNVYHYNLAGAQTGPFEAMLDEVKATEVTFHSSDVTFVRGAVWSSGGSPAQNQMLFQKDFTGTGNQSLNTSQDRERAVLVQWPAGLDSRGKPVYLRKWYHSCGGFAGQAFAATHLQNTVQLQQVTRDAIAAAADAMTNIGVAEAWELVAESGRVITGDVFCHPWLEHHQLGDMWR